MKRIRIGFDGQSKAVVASVQIEADDADGNVVLDEAKKLFEEADKFATAKTIQKMR
jgi:hypothetical protein